MRLRRGELRLSSSPLRKLLRPPGRQTNQALLVVLLFAFGTGIATVAIGSPDGAWVAIGHGICGVAVVLLIPWKSRVARGGLRRARLSRWLSLLLAALALSTLIAGLGYATGLVRSIAGQPGLWVHIAVALTLVPLTIFNYGGYRLVSAFGSGGCVGQGPTWLNECADLRAAKGHLPRSVQQ
jgi:hypothetical protein